MPARVIPPVHTPATKVWISPMRRLLVLKGYIKSNHGVYDAVCLTLNLVVRGGSIEEADQKLQDSIGTYLTDAQNSGRWDEMVPRKAPFSKYREYYLLKFLAQFRFIAEFKLFVRSAPLLDED